ncbi:hypothetical protein O0L34_g7258 [Tuta absoluta]|nr:hypothetical protein O0L34_g7258 [Tuta absoluta]
MEADSTTLDSSKDGFPESKLPFTSISSNLMLYNELSSKNGEKSLELQIVDRLQATGLIPKKVKCSTNEPGCKLDKKTARVIDKIQWACKSCGKRMPIRTGTFFLRIQCSILQTLQMILAWCEDADYEIAAHHFGVKPKVASLIYDKLDELAIKEMNKSQLGGEGSVVLTEMYPECLTRLSPDTTDQPHLHRVLMIADTKHVPTHYHLHVIKEGSEKNTNINSPAVKSEIEEVLSEKVSEGSCIVTGNHVPAVEGASSIQQLVQHCDADMQHFLTFGIWRQALTLCSASRDICDLPPSPSPSSTPSLSPPPRPCARAVQRYLLTALYRYRHNGDFYRQVLDVISAEYTEHCDDEDSDETSE